MRDGEMGSGRVLDCRRRMALDLEMVRSGSPEDHVMFGFGSRIWRRRSGESHVLKEIPTGSGKLEADQTQEQLG